MSFHTWHPWIVAAACIASVGCGAASYESDANDFDASSDAAAEDGGLIGDGGGCLSYGTAQVQVSLTIEPTTPVTPSDVWLVAMCLTGGNYVPVRIVQADPSGAATTLSQLGAGTYVVRASTLLVEGSATSQLLVVDGATVITSLTLAPGAPPIATAHISETNADGGAYFDATSIDAGLTMSTRVSFSEAGTAGASLQAMITPVGANTASVQLEVDAPSCDAGAGCSAQPVQLAWAEIHTSLAGVPVGYGIGMFSPTTVTTGSARLMMPLQVADSVTDPTMAFDIAVFGTVGSPDAGTGTPHDH